MICCDRRAQLHGIYRSMNAHLNVDIAAMKHTCGDNTDLS